MTKILILGANGQVAHTTQHPSDAQGDAYPHAVAWCELLAQRELDDRLVLAAPEECP